MADFVEASRAILYGALAIYLIRYLNVPPARLPAVGDDRLESMPSTMEEIRSALLEAFHIRLCQVVLRYTAQKPGPLTYKVPHCIHPVVHCDHRQPAGCLFF